MASDAQNPRLATARGESEGVEGVYCEQRHPTRAEHTGIFFAQLLTESSFHADSTLDHLCRNLEERLGHGGWRGRNE